MNDMLKYWNDAHVFERQQEIEDGPSFEFYEGPPFATGVPHYGHILNACIKDTVCRFHWMNGEKVKRVAGWDTHGLPIEHKIEERLKIKTKQEVEKFGIKNYNNECRSIVLECEKAWRTTMTKLGRWIDFDNAYKTMSYKYMASVWAVFHQIYTKGLVYKGFKVMPYSVACGTPLSNSEASSNYKDINDIAVTVKFYIDELKSYILVWTTTPWTLPSNTALCVNSNIVYVKIKDENNVSLICSKEYYTLHLQKYTIEKEFLGKELIDKTYTPLFATPFQTHKIVDDDFVTSEKGTGVTHLSPAFGEDDFRVCLKHGILKQDYSNLYCPIDDNGYFTTTIFKGMHIFDCTDDICKKLKEGGSLFKKEGFSHSYPHCWRSDTKLIYKAVDSWFVAVSKIKDQLVENNKKVNWVPSHVGEKRFHDWVSNAHDWNISRTRYWGCPIPIWENKETNQYIVIRSPDELPVKVEDLHRENIDDIIIMKDGLSLEEFQMCLIVGLKVELCLLPEMEKQNSPHQMLQILLVKG